MISAKKGETGMKKAFESLMIVIDVGGTHTRAHVYISCQGEIFEHPSFPHPQSENVQSLKDLQIFIRRVLKGITGKETSRKCFVGFAGPVVKHTEVEMVNWPGRPKIHLKELREWGLPKATLVVNDLKAAAYGLLDIEDIQSSCQKLFEPENWDEMNRRSNRILLVPGTGLGTAGIVTVKTGEDEYYSEPVASEVQHSAVPMMNTNPCLIKWLTDHGKSAYSGEDFASGQSLPDIYEGLRHIKGDNGIRDLANGEDKASAIARHGVSGTNKICEEALKLFYQCVGQVAQMMALAFLPYGGIFLGGGSTIKNERFIRESGFVEALHANPAQSELLKHFPVYLVLDELNLRGGLWACQHRSHLFEGRWH
jgi:glucokinase